jgi:NAD(P)H-flavin reductase
MSLYRSSTEVQAARAGLGNKVFHIFISVNSFPELIMPDEMNIINAAGSIAKIYVRVTGAMPPGAFQGYAIDPKMKFSRQLVQQNIAPLAGNLRMVYICGPQQMYKDMTGYLTEIGVGMDKIFYV